MPCSACWAVARAECCSTDARSSPRPFSTRARKVWSWALADPFASRRLAAADSSSTSRWSMPLKLDVSSWKLGRQCAAHEVKEGGGGGGRTYTCLLLGEIDETPLELDGKVLLGPSEGRHLLGELARHAEERGACGVDDGVVAGFDARLAVCRRGSRSAERSSRWMKRSAERRTKLREEPVGVFERVPCRTLPPFSALLKRVPQRCLSRKLHLGNDQLPRQGDQVVRLPAHFDCDPLELVLARAQQAQVLLKLGPGGLEEGLVDLDLPLGLVELDAAGVLLLLELGPGRRGEEDAVLLAGGLKVKERVSIFSGGKRSR